MAVTAVAPKYQWAETTSSARGRGSVRPSDFQASVKPFRSSVFIGLPWPMNSAGIRPATIMPLPRDAGGKRPCPASLPW